MKIYGITGGSGSGKTTLLTEFEKRGALVIDCDEVYHRLLGGNIEMIAEIAEAFPGTVDPVKREVNRKALGAVVFADAEKLHNLNAITHKYVDIEITRQITESACSVAAIDAIALIESGIAGKCERIIAVTAPVEVRVERLTKREGISREYALTRIAAQHSDEWFAARADYVLYNSGTEAEFTLKCSRLLDGLLNDA